MSKARPSKEFRNFTAGVDKLLSVPRDVIEKRMAEYREQLAHKPNKRGPKPKPSGS